MAQFTPHLVLGMTAQNFAASSAGSHITTICASPLQHATFPVKLHAMLTEIEQTGLHSHIVTWRPHGRLFVVNDRQRLIQEVLPWYVQAALSMLQQ
jgi:hypothetical protein